MSAKSAAVVIVAILAVASVSPAVANPVTAIKNGIEKIRSDLHLPGLPHFNHTKMPQAMQGLSGFMKAFGHTGVPNQMMHGAGLPNATINALRDVASVAQALIDAEVNKTVAAVKRADNVTKTVLNLALKLARGAAPSPVEFLIPANATALKAALSGFKNGTENTVGIIIGSRNGTLPGMKNGTIPRSTLNKARLQMALVYPTIRKTLATFGIDIPRLVTMQALIETVVGKTGDVTPEMIVANAFAVFVKMQLSNIGLPALPAIFSAIMAMG